MRNIEHIFLNFLRKISLLSVSANHKTYVFGLDFVAEICYFVENTITYMSRGFYRDNLEMIESNEKWRGIHPEIDDDEKRFAYHLLKSRLSDTNKINVFCYMDSISNSICKKCSGKGYLDWVEESLEPSFACNTNFTSKMLSPSYNEHILYESNTYILYRRRNFKSEYMKDCTVCDECSGLGFERNLLESYFSPRTVDLLRMLAPCPPDYMVPDLFEPLLLGSAAISATRWE